MSLIFYPIMFRTSKQVLEIIPMDKQEQMENKKKDLIKGLKCYQLLSKISLLKSRLLLIKKLLKLF